MRKNGDLSPTIDRDRRNPILEGAGFAPVGDTDAPVYHPRMQPFPTAEILQALVGDGIAQIRLDPNSVQILFESGLALFVQDRLEHECVGQPRYEYQCEAWRDGPSLLHRLIQKTVTGIERQDWSLVIRLNDGSSLTIHSDNSNFESGHFQYPDGGAIVY